MASAVDPSKIRQQDSNNAPEIRAQLTTIKSEITALQARQATLQADTTAVDLAALKVDFNALLTKLKASGLMASS